MFLNACKSNCLFTDKILVMDKISEYTADISYLIFTSVTSQVYSLDKLLLSLIYDLKF